MRKNNFDIVRLLLSLVVVLVHSEDLSLHPALAPIRTWLSARLGVECFFVISGFLIFASYERCATLRTYFTNRALRILPAYWLATAFCLLIAFAHGSFHVGKWLLANLTFASFLHGGIDGVFMSNPGGSAMNGALWTIKIEVMFYLAVPLIAWLYRKVGHRDAVLWSLMAASIAFRLRMAHHESLAVQLPGQLSFFMAGALIYFHQDLFKRRGWLFFALAAALFALHTFTGWYWLRPAAVGGLTLSACLLLPQIKGPTRWGDFSYGTYILHWPILQILVAAGLFVLHPWRALLLALLLVGTGAVLSWNMVEKPALGLVRSRKERLAASGAAANYPPAVP